MLSEERPPLITQNNNNNNKKYAVSEFEIGEHETDFAYLRQPPKVQILAEVCGLKQGV